MKKFYSVCAAMLCALFSVVADVTPEEAYIKKYAPLAVSEMQRSGVPASITLAQGLLESGAGRSTLAVKGNNHFGIKCGKWTGKSIKHDDDAPQECFRAYDRPEQSYRDHSDFLRYSDRYKPLFDLEPKDYKGWAMGLRKAGYATDPKYATKLISIIEKYGLDVYDRGHIKPLSPLTLEEPKKSPVKYEENCEFALLRPVYQINGLDFVYSQAGETYASIAQTYSLFHKEILSFNELDKDEELLPGTIVYLQRKKSRTQKGLDKYVVSENGESLYSISQRFGVRMHSIIKRNKLIDGHYLKEGEVLLLR